jgi:hypothetical protein
MRIVLVSVVISTLVLASGCGGAESTPVVPVGNLETFSRIDSFTSCALLQGEFDQFDFAHGNFLDAGDLDNAKAATAYMEATFDRQKALGCFDSE